MSIGNLNTAPEEMKAGRTEQRRPEATVRRLRAGNEDITIGENSILEGSFDTQGAMFVDGAAVNADLRAAHLSIGTTGRVEGQATVLRAEIAGSFDGMLECAGEIILRSSSRIAGEIKCAKLVTHRGAIIAAQVRIVDDERPEDEQGRAALSAFAPAAGGLLNRRKLRRAVPVGYGVLLALGAMGIVSFLS
ncbi:MAG: polymer-forming cytoskeletal protein [Parvibaculum sp.]|uniref:bactofilin family protein n=1 Tax=Parvibaculum sp. TaxID=2024848 RepID=UPI0032ED1992